MHEKQDPVLARQPGGVGVNRWAWHPALECAGCVALANLLATGKSMPLSHLFSPGHVIFFHIPLSWFYNEVRFGIKPSTSFNSVSQQPLDLIRVGKEETWARRK